MREKYKNPQYINHNYIRKCFYDDNGINDVEGLFSSKSEDIYEFKVYFMYVKNE